MSHAPRRIVGAVIVDCCTKRRRNVAGFDKALSKDILVAGLAAALPEVRASADLPRLVFDERAVPGVRAAV